MNFFDHIKAAFAQPDPMRYAQFGEAVAGWNGEFYNLPGKTRGEIEQRVEIDAGGNVTFNEGNFTHLDIPEHLTQWEREMLAGGWNAKKVYDPNRPEYSTAKKIFARNPTITNEELASQSRLSPDTVKDVAAIFRAGFKELLKKQQKR